MQHKQNNSQHLNYAAVTSFCFIAVTNRDIAHLLEDPNPLHVSFSRHCY